MTTKSLLKTLRCSLILSTLAAGCVESDATEDLATPDLPATAPIAGVQAPALTLLGTYTPSTASPDDIQPQPRPTAEGPARVETDPTLVALADGRDGRFGVIYVDFDHHAEYTAAYDAAALAAAAPGLMRRGLSQASKGPDDPMPTVANGLSNNQDDRISFQGYPVTHSTLRKVGRVGGGCTGALFGTRLVLTAAHCIFDSSGMYRQFNTFQARRNGTDLPYGSVTSQGAVYPISFKNDGCNTNYTSSCVRNDWAILILPANPWASSPNGAPGYFGFASASDGAVSDWSLRNIGYPACGDAMSPAGCVNNVAYGDLTCSNAPARFGGADDRWPLGGDNGKMDTGCDTNAGHSGGPIYSYDPGTNGPYLVANTVWNQCNSSSCAADTEYSSSGARINQTLFDYMLGLRASYP